MLFVSEDDPRYKSLANLDDLFEGTQLKQSMRGGGKSIRDGGKSIRDGGKSTRAANVGASMSRTAAPSLMDSKLKP